MNNVPESVDDYIALQPPKVQVHLKKIRQIIRKESPKAVEKISYRMPSYHLDGVLIYFAAFKSHIGIFPPVKGSAVLMKKLSKHQNEKGNLRFNFDEPIPYPLIREVVLARIKQNRNKFAAKKSKKKTAR